MVPKRSDWIIKIVLVIYLVLFILTMLVLAYFCVQDAASWWY